MRIVEKGARVWFRDYHFYRTRDVWDIGGKFFVKWCGDFVEADYRFGWVAKGDFGVMVFNSRGSSGNIFAVLGSAINELRKDGRASDCGELRERVFACGSYEDALGVIGEYVPLFDKGTGKVYGGC